MSPYSNTVIQMSESSELCRNLRASHSFEFRCVWGRQPSRLWTGLESSNIHVGVRPQCFDLGLHHNITCKCRVQSVGQLPSRLPGTPLDWSHWRSNTPCKQVEVDSSTLQTLDCFLPKSIPVNTTEEHTVRFQIEELRNKKKHLLALSARI